MSTAIKTSGILLAGGTGSRMKNTIPKQFLKLNQKTIALYSFEVFLAMEEVQEIVVVCVPEYRNTFTLANPRVPIRFALPGPRRQDSVYNGLQEVQQKSDWVAVHDSARPFINEKLVRQVLEAAALHQAAAPGLPSKNTLKRIDADQFVETTLDRSFIWEIQTPQIIRYDLLVEGYKQIAAATVTDDVSLIEHLKKPVKLVEGIPENLKITTPVDLHLAELMVKDWK